MSIQGQGHSLTLAQGHSDMKIKTCFFSETTRPFVTKFHRKAFRNTEMKINKYEFGHMTNMAFMPYGKIIYIFKHLLLWNHLADWSQI